MEKVFLEDQQKEPREERGEESIAKAGTLERLAEQSARVIGSVPSLIVHSIFFVGIFALSFFGLTFEQILLILTTVVSLEAIYLAIFIQMTVNRQAEDIVEVQEDIEDIQEYVEDISEDIEGIQEDVEEISEDVEDISEDIEKDETQEAKEKETTDKKLEKIEIALQSLVRDIENLRRDKD